MLNRQERELLDEDTPPAPMRYDEMVAAVAAGAVLIDGRDPEEFARGHLRVAINIGLAGRYAEFAGSVVQPDVDIVLMVERGDELQSKNRLARIGFDRVIGCLDDAYKAMFVHRDEVRVASRLTAASFEERRKDIADLQIVDVRNPGEVADGSIVGAIPIPVGQLPSPRPSSTRIARPSSTAPAGTDRRSPRACCAGAASPTSPTSSAATTPTRQRSIDPRIVDELTCSVAASGRGRRHRHGHANRTTVSRPAYGQAPRFVADDS